MTALKHDLEFYSRLRHSSLESEPQLELYAHTSRIDKRPFLIVCTTVAYLKIIFQAVRSKPATRKNILAGQSESAKEKSSERELQQPKKKREEKTCPKVA